MKLRIVSDGTYGGTRVTTADGREIKGVTEVRWSIEVPGIAELSIKVRGVPIDAEGLLGDG